MDARYLKKYNWKSPPQKQMPRSIITSKSYEKYLRSESHITFIEGVKKKLEKSNIYFEMNLFPYDVKPPIRHSCIWYKSPLTPQDVENYLSDQNIDYITFFENDNRLKSVKEISHYHIFHY